MNCWSRHLILPGSPPLVFTIRVNTLSVPFCHQLLGVLSLSCDSVQDHLTPCDTISLHKLPSADRTQQMLYVPVCPWLSGEPLCRDTPVCERSELASEHAAAAKQQAMRWAARRAAQEAAEAKCHFYLAEQVFGQMAAMAAQELEYRELGGGAPAPKGLRREWELLFVAGTLGTLPQLVSRRKHLSTHLCATFATILFNGWSACL